MNQTDKRQLLAELLNGNIEALQTYQNQQLASDSPYRWIVDERLINGNIIAVYKDGRKKQLSEQELNQLPNSVNVWHIQDHSGGILIPAPDEDDRSG